MPLPVDSRGRDVVAVLNGYEVVSAPSELVFAGICNMTRIAGFLERPPLANAVEYSGFRHS